jgi:nitrate/nitrite transporter NarK
VMGYLNDRFGPREMLAIWAILPLVIALIFLAIYMRDRTTGGYKVEKLQTRAGI